MVDCGNANATPHVEVRTGHVATRVKKPGKMYLGLEHSTTRRLNGYVVNNLADEIRKALMRGEHNPTLDGTDRL